MSRYICVDDAKRIINEEFDGVCVYDVGQSEVINDFERIIDMCPSADVKPTLYGHWKKELFDISIGSDDEVPVMACSVCRRVYQSSWKFPYNFCPNCGADMRRKEDG